MMFLVQACVFLYLYFSNTVVGNFMKSTSIEKEFEELLVYEYVLSILKMNESENERKEQSKSRKPERSRLLKKIVFKVLLLFPHNIRLRV